MEKPLEQSGDHMSLEAFRAQIASMKESAADAHFRAINPEELGPDELAAYELYRNETLSLDDFEEIRREYMAQHPGATLEADSRGNFYAWLGNALWLKSLRK